MAGRGEGWFIDARNGEVIPIIEHKTAVLMNPARFRVTAEELRGLDRAAILLRVFKQGFIRVRDHVGQVTFQFHGHADDAVQAIKNFCAQRYGMSDTLLVLQDFERQTQAMCKAREIGAGPLAWEPWTRDVLERD